MLLQNNSYNNRQKHQDYRHCVTLLLLLMTRLAGYKWIEEETYYFQFLTILFLTWINSQQDCFYLFFCFIKFIKIILNFMNY